MCVNRTPLIGLFISNLEYIYHHQEESKDLLQYTI